MRNTNAPNLYGWITDVVLHFWLIVEKDHMLSYGVSLELITHGADFKAYDTDYLNIQMLWKKANEYLTVLTGL